MKRITARRQRIFVLLLMLAIGAFWAFRYWPRQVRIEVRWPEVRTLEQVTLSCSVEGEPLFAKQLSFSKEVRKSWNTLVSMSPGSYMCEARATFSSSQLSSEGKVAFEVPEQEKVLISID